MHNMGTSLTVKCRLRLHHCVSVCHTACVPAASHRCGRSWTRICHLSLPQHFLHRVRSMASIDSHTICQQFTSAMISAESLFAHAGVEGGLLGSTCCVSSSKRFLWPTAVKTMPAISPRMPKTAGEKCSTLCLMAASPGSSREDSKSMTWQRQSQPYCAETHWLNWKMLYASSIAQTHSYKVQVLSLAQAETSSCLESSSGIGKASMCAIGA